MAPILAVLGLLSCCQYYYRFLLLHICHMTKISTLFLHYNGSKWEHKAGWNTFGNWHCAYSHELVFESVETFSVQNFPIRFLVNHSRRERTWLISEGVLAVFTKKCIAIAFCNASCWLSIRSIRFVSEMQFRSMQRIPRFCLTVNWNREKLYTAVLVPEFHAANFALCGWYVLKLGPGFHCSSGSTLSCTKSVGLCVVMSNDL